ncbi:Nramp-domain-containing protein [Laetiporus sulphureus 93-53]|uniref:Nramp-domain-containing protein n=1 Tax=Laetiporus sulphureus 93-53 TaxID=1314785 RepID=A0A165FD49_9APHY|nr:Nramp-domain-containing protein [Laetiporus sulphureus 93-53]KZT08789.1 Nramp-domain-containing protein [Laetiporus sulphureus 93-53]
MPGERTKGSRASWLRGRLRATVAAVTNHATRHTGVGLICAVAYFDPGNWGTDLQSGSEFGYKLLFVVLFAGLIAVYMQVLSSRLGCVTGLDLASHCRLLLHDRPKHKLLWRWLVLYPLYVASEVAIVATDLAELLGSAIAICLLFPRVPLWAGVLITAADVLILLAMRNPLDGKPVRVFEIVIAALVFTVLVCMAVVISNAGVHWGEAFDGFVPSHVLVTSSGLYNSVGILGATVMPHSLFLGSAFATQERETPQPPSDEEDKDKNILAKVETCEPDAMSDIDSLVPTNAAGKSWKATLPRWRVELRPRILAMRVWRKTKECFRVSRIEDHPEGEPKSHKERENKSLAFVRTHMNHGIVDMVLSLLGLAVVINALILILASAVFYYGYGQTGDTSPATLFDAYDLLRDNLGKPAAILFALALLASGQSSSIVATLAGQTVSEGFIRWRTSPVLRRLLTRCLGLIPSMVVAASLGRGGVSALLVISQVVLSIVLPFVVFPLLYLTSSKAIMSVKKPTGPISRSVPSSSLSPGNADPTAIARPATPSAAEGATTVEEVSPAQQVDVEAVDEIVDFSNGKFTMGLGWLLWLLIVLANAYAIVTLALGED